MNSSLHEIQSDLQRLASQQNQLQIPVSQNPQPQLQSFATLQNNFMNSRQAPVVNYATQPQIHSLLYNNPQWHSLVNQSPTSPQQAFTHHNNFVNQQQQQQQVSLTTNYYLFKITCKSHVSFKDK